jgi:competence protein ComEC
VYNLTIIKTLLYYAFFLFLIYSIKTRKRIYAISAVFLFSNTLIWSNLISGQSDKLKIAFIDVGQGDATLLSLPDGKNILIDAGPKNDNFDSGEKIVYPFLKREGIEKIDYCFISHFHDDHFGGLPFLIKKGMIKTIYFGDSSGCGTICKSLDSLSKSNDVVYKKIDFDKLNIDNSQMYILNRNNYKDIARVKDSISGSNLNIHSGKLTKRKNSAPKTSKNTIENNCSSVLKFCYGNISLLFMGDSEKDKENELIKNYGNFLKSDILKVAHHGSKSGTTDGFIEIVKPDISIIFAGQGNKFKFPSKSVVERIKKNGINLLRTDLEGAIILKTDGKNIERIEWN